MKAPAGYRWRSYDAAHRFADGLGLHYTVLSVDELLAGRWVVVRLSDGAVTPTAFDTHADALRHAPGLESLFAYFRLPLTRPNAHECDVLLWFVRRAYDNGHRPDLDRPDHALIIPGASRVN